MSGWLSAKRRGKDDVVIERDRFAAREKRKQVGLRKKSITMKASNVSMKRPRGDPKEVDPETVITNLATGQSNEGEPKKDANGGVNEETGVEKLRHILRMKSKQKRQYEDRMTRKRAGLMQEIRSEAMLFRRELNLDDYWEVTTKNEGINQHVSNSITPDHKEDIITSEVATRQASQKRKWRFEVDPHGVSLTSPCVVGRVKRTVSQTQNSGRYFDQATTRLHAELEDINRKNQTPKMLTPNPSDCCSCDKQSRLATQEESTFEIHRPKSFDRWKQTPASDGEVAESNDLCHRTKSQGGRTILFFQDFATSATILEENRRRGWALNDPKSTIRTNRQLDRPLPVPTLPVPTGGRRNAEWKSCNMVLQPIQNGDASQVAMEGATPSNQNEHSINGATTIAVGAEKPCKEVADRTVGMSEASTASELTVLFTDGTRREENLTNDVKSRLQDTHLGCTSHHTNSMDRVKERDVTGQPKDMSPRVDLSNQHINESQVSILSLPRHAYSSSLGNSVVSTNGNGSANSMSFRMKSQLPFVQTTMDPLTDLAFWKSVLSNETEAVKKNSGVDTFRNVIAGLIIAKNEKNQKQKDGFLWLPSLLEGDIKLDTSNA